MRRGRRRDGEGRGGERGVERDRKGYHSVRR